MKEIIRVVVTGPTGSGKSSYIRNLSELELSESKRDPECGTNLAHQETKLEFDFGRFNRNPEQVVHLYGISGQTQFDFMRDLMIRRAHSYILLLAADSPQEIKSGRAIIEFMQSRIQLPWIIGITRRDCPGAWRSKNIIMKLGLWQHPNCPTVVAINATERQSVTKSLNLLLRQLEPQSPAPVSYLNQVVTKFAG